MNDPEHRAKAERESAEDYEKAVPHLLADVFDELLRHDAYTPGRKPHALKRIAALDAVIAKEAANNSNKQFEAAMQSARTQEAYAKEATSILAALNDFSSRFEKQSALTERKIFWFNVWMSILTVLGLGVGCLSVYLAWKVDVREERKEQFERVSQEAASAKRQSAVSIPSIPSDVSGTPLMPASDSANPGTQTPIQSSQPAPATGPRDQTTKGL